MEILGPTISILGKITTGPDEYSNFLVAHGILESLEKLLENTDVGVRK